MDNYFSGKCAAKLFLIAGFVLVGACAVKTPNRSLQLPEAMRGNYFIRSSNGSVALAEPVKQIALSIQAQKLEFDGKLLTDCSGIFHRFLYAMQKEYPEFEYPPVPPGKYRTTRGMALWYHERGQLMLVREKDVFEMDRFIRPGAVLFYGYEKRRYTSFTAKDLFVPGTGIGHMGIVVDVVRDGAGNALSYTLFHGHGRKARPAVGSSPAKPGTFASITNWHRRKPTRSNYSPFGNGTQQWIAVARLLPYIPEL